MLIDNQFELEIPTHIFFTLYKNDYIDNLIISRVKNECKNESKKKNEFIVSLDDFNNAIKTSSLTLGHIPLKPNKVCLSRSGFFMEILVNILKLKFQANRSLNSYFE